jgi:ubiquitin carboxyl-terminal hydrolase 25/28
MLTAPRLFYGKLRQRISSVDARPRARPSVHEREDLFSHLPLNVSDEGYDLYDGLSGYFDDDVEFEGKKAHMEVSIVDLPPVLQIQLQVGYLPLCVRHNKPVLQRVQFDRETMQAYKSQAYVKFGEEIRMDRYLDRADPQKKARAKALQASLAQRRQRIDAISRGRVCFLPLFFPRLAAYAITQYVSSLENTLNLVRKYDGLGLAEADDELVNAVFTEIGALTEDVHELRTSVAALKAELEQLWSGDAAAVYELTSVFIHRGASPSWGHYFFYARNLPARPDQWFKYNDSEVLEVSKEEVFRDTTGDTANPYLVRILSALTCAEHSLTSDHLRSWCMHGKDLRLSIL